MDTEINKLVILLHLLLIAGCHGNDLLALLSFKASISHDPHQALASWNNNNNNSSPNYYCHWHGVKCNLRHSSRVIELNLDALDIGGTISPAISNLTFLHRLSLSNNRLQGHIPQELGNLRRLRSLNLSTNFLTGEIPSTLSQCSQLKNISLKNNNLQGEVPSALSKCINLEIISLSNNFLRGNIPSSIGNISNLMYLDISNNYLTGELPSSLGNLTSLAYFFVGSNSLSGGIPSWFGGLSMLRGLMLDENNISGSIPHSLGFLSSLLQLDLAFNQLSGIIPPSLFNFSYIQYLVFSGNQFSGTLPQDLGNYLPCLRRLSMYSNRLQGPIPTSLANATKLEIIEFSVNNLRGNIPSNLGNLQALSCLTLNNNELEATNDEGWNFLTSIQNCSKLQILGLENNKLGGSLSRSIGNLSKSLSWLVLGENQLSGTLPAEIGNLDGLMSLSIVENQFVGNIPITISKLQNLQALYLYNNKFSGPIPDSFGNLTKLLILSMNGNTIDGRIPASLGKCKTLEFLDLSRNMLTGVIPKEILSLESLSQVLDLSYNLLSGFLPSEVGSLKNIGMLDVAFNNLSGKIPSTIGECTILEILRMESNQFQGTIPQSLSSLKGLRELDISQNNLSGLIPKFLEDFIFINYLNLSFNSFEGEVPSKGVFRNVSGVSLTGNDRLCGGDPRLNLSPCPLQSQKRTHDTLRLKVILSISISLLLLFLLVCLLAFLHWLHNKKKKTPASCSMKNLHAKVSYFDLLKATNGFSSENLIGEGTFGRVYKGIIDLDEQQVVAIKVLNLEKHGASKSFEAECNVLSNIRHRNLVKIISSCSSIDYKGKDFKALIFEYMSKESLEKWLHPELGQDQNQAQCLSLIQRLNIAIDVASALDYLHHHGPTPIVHCDLKPSNVLLDDGMTAHVGDFGLARFIATTTSRPSHNSSMSIGIKGTIGYVPPEYGMTNQVSVVGDVYSYGIFLLELLTAKKPTDISFKNSVNLHIFVQNAMQRYTIDIIDPFLIFEGRGESVEERVKRKECWTLILKIGLLCSMESPRERMKIDEAIKQLHWIRNKFQFIESR